MDPVEAKTIVLFVKSKKQITVYEVNCLFKISLDLYTKSIKLKAC